MSINFYKECSQIQKNLKKVLVSALNEHLGTGITGSRTKVQLSVFRARSLG